MSFIESGNFQEEAKSYQQAVKDAIRSVDKRQRVKEVNETLETIRLAITDVQGKPYRAEGLVMLDGLSFSFTAYRVGLAGKPIAYLEDTEAKEESSWSVYVPVRVGEYLSPDPSAPKLTAEQRTEAYEAFHQKYREDPVTRSRYSAAVQLACNRGETAVKAQEELKQE